MDIDHISAYVSIDASDNPDKIDLEITCDHCNELICDIEAGDTLSALLTTADNHLRRCTKAGV